MSNHNEIKTLRSILMEILKYAQTEDAIVKVVFMFPKEKNGL